MNVVIETERLLLRTFTLEDAELVFALNKDPEVIRYTGDPVRDLDHARDILENIILPQYALYNHGRWAVLVKPGHDPECNGFIGWCGLKTRPERNEIDLGYRFIRKSWGKGYATEAAFACLNYGFSKLKINRIIGRALPQNIASLKVLEKCGMHYVGKEVVDDHPALTYEAFNPFIR